MGRGRATSSSSSPIESRSHFFFSSNGDSSSSSSSHRDLSTDLRLGLSISNARRQPLVLRQLAYAEEENECSSASFYVKVYMDGFPIVRKLDLLAHENYYDLIRTLQQMFNTNIIWAEPEVEVDECLYEKCHVLTYEDKEGDWMMVGDVPWEMFLSAVRRLKITNC